MHHLPTIVDHYDKLYLEAERRRIKQEQNANKINENATFKPNIHHSTSSSNHSSAVNKTRNSTRTLDAEDSEEFFNRLVYSKKESDRHLEQLRLQANSNVDPETGRELFKPCIGKHPSHNIEREKPIYFHLYQQGTEIEEDRDRLTFQHEQDIIKQASMHHTSSNSEKIVELSKQRKISQLFNYFDQDNDGYIHLIKDVDMSFLEPELVKDLHEVFSQFDQNQLLSYNQFMSAMLHHIESTKFQGAKITLLNSFSKKRAEYMKRKMILHNQISAEQLTEEQARDAILNLVDDQCTFQPSLNRHSESLVNQQQDRKRALQQSGGIYHVLLREREKWKVKLDILKSEVESEKIKECTFKPVLVSKKNNTSIM
ncbi:hypothetical protein AKO1_004337, partial [Acrasis kona]